MLACYFRAFFSATGLLLASIWFVQSSPANDFPQVLFLSSGTLLVLFLFNLVQPRWSRLIQLICTLLMAALCVFILATNHLSQQFTLAFAALCQIVDILGITLLPNLIQKSVHPTLFPTAMRQFYTSELVGRLLTSVVGLVATSLHPLVLPLVLLSTLSAYLLQMSRVSVRQDGEPQTLSSLKSYSGIFLKNHLLLLGLGLLIWSNIAKQVLDLSYFHSLQSLLSSPIAQARWMTGMDLILTVSSILFLRYLSPSIFHKFSLSQITSFLPLGMIVLAGSVLLSGSLPAVFILNGFYLILFRGLHRPLVKQTTLPLSPQEQDLALIMFSILNFLASFLTSSGLWLLRPLLDLDFSMLTLLILSVLLLLAIGQMDTLYIRSFWKQLVEKETPADLSLQISSSESLVGASVFSDLEKFEPKVELATEQLRNRVAMAKSGDERARALHLALATTTDLNFFRACQTQVLQLLREHPHSPACRELLEAFPARLRWKILLHTGMQFQKTEPHDALEQTLFKDMSLMTRIQLKSVLRTHPEWTEIILSLDREAKSLVEDVADILSKSFSRKDLLIEGLRGSFSLSPLLRHVRQHSLQQCREELQMLASLGKHREDEIHSFIADCYHTLVQLRFRFSEREPLQRFELFQKAAFLDASLIAPKSMSRTIRNSIIEALSAPKEDFLSASSMYRSFLLQGPHRKWIRQLPE